jgi:uncharacterized membrane protein YeaQ/YmgE (transglycosylase-associated protein family)
MWIARRRRPAAAAGRSTEGGPTMLNLLNIVVWLAVGMVVGAVAGLLMRHDEDAAVFPNVIVGVVGALAAGWWVSPLLGVRVTHPGVFNFGALALSLLGAVGLLAVVSVVRQRPRDEAGEP